MPCTADDLVATFDLQRLGPNHFSGSALKNGWRRIYGGQVLAQALIAAERTVEGRAAHSVHGYFILGGDPKERIDFEVDRIRDGRSFATRRVVARQRGIAIFVMSASFHSPENGFEYAMAAPDAPPVASLPTPVQIAATLGKAGDGIRAFAEHAAPIELIPTDLARYAPQAHGVMREPRQKLWIRIGGRLPDDPAIHRAALLYLSDMTLLETALATQGLSFSGQEIMGASLDHSFWLHRPCRADEWLLYATDNPSSSAGRALTRGMLYDSHGVLAASAAQEGVLRRRTKPRPDA